MWPIRWMEGGFLLGVAFSLILAGETNAQEAVMQFRTGASLFAAPLRGPDGTLYVGSADTHFYALAPDGTEKWRFKTNDEVWATAAFGPEDTVLFGSLDHHLYALRPDGSLAWKCKLGGPLFATPVVSESGLVLVGAHDGVLSALRPPGEVVWRYRTGDHIQYAVAAHGHTVYVGSWTGVLSALDGNSGELKWTFATANAIWARPAIAPDGTVYCASFDGNLYALTPEGMEKWRVKTGGFIPSSPALAPDGTIYFTSGDGNLYAVTPAGEVRWKHPISADAGAFTSAAVGAEGTVYLGHFKGHLEGKYFLLAVGPDGQTRWEREWGQVVVSTPLVLPGERLCFGSADGSVYVIDGQK